jgi:hypothetical protein
MTLDTNVSLVDLNSKLFFTKFLSSIFCKIFRKCSPGHRQRLYFQ